MTDKGYTKIGVIFKSHGVLDILLIHKDWNTFNLPKQVRQAFKDIPEKIRKEYIFTVEVPTRDIYDNERTKDAPKHKILVDLDPYPVKSLWTRHGLFYYATVQIFRGQRSVGNVTKKLDFLSYHLIKRFHGVKVLNHMAMKTAIDNIFGP
jgi:hypothetical protein